MAVTFNFPSSITVSTFVYISGTEDASTADGLTGALRTRGGLSVTKAGYFGGSIRVASTTDATDATGTTGALGVIGGLSVAKSGRFGGAITAGGYSFIKQFSSSYTASGTILSNSLTETATIFADLGVTSGGGSNATLRGLMVSAGGSEASSATISAATALDVQPYFYAGAGIIQNMYGLRVLRPNFSTDGTVTSHGILIQDYGTGEDPYVAGITYALKIEDQTGAAIRYAIHTGLGRIRFGDISEYADNAAALLAGLTSGIIYRTGDILKIVH